MWKHSFILISCQEFHYFELDFKVGRYWIILLNPIILGKRMCIYSVMEDYIFVFFYLFTLKNISNHLMIYIIYDYLMNVEVIYDKKPLQRNKVYCMSRKNRSCMYIITTWFSFLLGYKKCWNGTFEKGVLGQMYLTWKVGIG